MTLGSSLHLWCHFPYSLNRDNSNHPLENIKGLQIWADDVIILGTCICHHLSKFLGLTDSLAAYLGNIFSVYISREVTLTRQSNKDLLYSSGNSTQFSVMTYMGKESEKVDMCMCIMDSLCFMAL